MGNQKQILPNYTYEDYCLWKGRWEIINGIAYAMSPMPTGKHQAVSSKLSRIFLNALDDATCKCEVYQPIDIKIAENTVVNPDLSIVCPPFEKQYLSYPPALVVEILSPSTALKDRNTKFDLYRNFGIKYYLIVDPIKETMETYVLQKDGSYQLIGDHATFQLHNGCSISPDFSTLWT